MACLTALSGKFSTSRMPPLVFSLEIDEAIYLVSFFCCTLHVRRCVDFKLDALSSLFCLAMHLRTWADDIWYRKFLYRRRLRLSADRSCDVPGTHNTQHLRRQELRCHRAGRGHVFGKSSQIPHALARRGHYNIGCLGSVVVRASDS